MKGGRAAAEPAVAASEGFQKLLTQYERGAEGNSLNYVLLSVGGEVLVDKNGGDGGSFDGGGSDTVLNLRTE